MKIVLINGNARHGSTWNCAQLFLEELAKHDTVEVSEFSLPRDMPHFCNGCFSCFYNGEQTCPHAASISPILETLLAADLVILTSPIYAMDISGQMKALLDHLCFMWFSHRPNPQMFDKVGLTITTTAGAGLSHATKTLRNSLKFWGVKRTFSFQNAVSAMKWADVSEQKRAKIGSQIGRMAGRIAGAVKHRDQLSSPLFRRFFFRLMRGMMQKNTWNPRDRQHWEAQGWLSGAKPF